MKRINRKKLIADLDFYRQGFASALLNAKINKDKIGEIAYESYHRNINRLIIDLGGENVRSEI